MPTPGKRLIPSERIDLAQELFLAGRSRQYITRTLCDRFAVKVRCARKYIQIAEEKIAALPKPPPEAAFQRAEAMLLEAYNLAKNGVHRFVVSQGKGLPSQVEEFSEANVGVMSTVAVRLAELYGVGGTQKIDLTSGGKPLTTLSDDELAARVAALEAVTATAKPR